MKKKDFLTDLCLAFTALLIPVAAVSLIHNVLELSCALIAYGLISSLQAFKVFSNFAHPMVVIPALCVIYSVVFPLYFGLGGERIAAVSQDSVLLSLKYSFGFLATFQFFSLFISRRFLFSTVPCSIERKKIYKFGGLSIWLVFATFLLLFLPALVAGSSGMSKADRMVEGVSFFQAFIGGLMLPFGLLQVYSLRRRGRFEWISAMSIFGLGVIGFIQLGERDMLLHPILICLIISAFYYRPSIIKLALIAFFIVLLLYILGLVRSLGETGMLRPISSLVLILQENEFISAARNLSALIESSISSPNTLFGDALYPFLGSRVLTGTVWFSHEFYENKGFGAIAEGVANAGLVGVAFIAIIFSVVLHFFFHKAMVSLVYRAIYPIILIAALYSLRSDLAALSSAGVRKVLIPLFFLWLLDGVLKKIRSPLRTTLPSA